MQKPLITHSFALYTLWQRISLFSKAGALSGLTLLLLLTGFANPAKAGSGFYKDYVVINGKYYYTIHEGNDQFNESFFSIRNNNLGSFDRGNGQLQLGAEANTFNDNGDNVESAQLFYRVYQQGTAGGVFTALELNFEYGGGDNNGNNKKWSNNASRPNLVASTSGPGTYVLEFFFQGRTVTNRADGSNYLIFDSNKSGNYFTTFNITGNIPVQWSGNSGNNSWFNEANWNTIRPDGSVQVGPVPNEITDATIPFTGSAGNYPRIEGGQARVRTLRITGNNNALGARNVLVGGELQIYGNLDDPNGGFLQTGGVLTLAGATQTFDGGSFFDVRIQGGGTKILRNRMDIINSLNFLGQGGIISTRTDNTGLYSIDLGPNAQIVGENGGSYVQGILRTTRQVRQNETNTFGNIGVELTAADRAPGLTLVTRRTGLSYTGVNNSRSIERGFAFTPANPENLNFSLVFRYLEVEQNNISEGVLLLFRSITGGVPFQNLGKTDSDPEANTLTRTFIGGTLAATFTLGDAVTPLPVTVTSFTAAAQGADAVLTWATAQEINSKGFEVQVSSDGKNFRTLEFVASASPNSSAPRSYEFRDAEAGKQGTRYYRLRQLDLDGKSQFIGSKSLTFGALTAASVQAFPNPFGGEINLKLQTVAAGQATVSVLDGVGRRVHTWQPTLQAGASDLQLPGLQSLSRGLYVVEVRYQDGHVQRLKLMKE